MKYHVRDWVDILIIVLFAPIVFGVLYMVLVSSVVNVDNGFIYLLVLFIIFLWMLINTIMGYTINRDNMTLSYPHSWGLLRKKIDLHSITSYKLIGFDEYSVSDNGLGLSKFKIVLKGDIEEISLTFNRQKTAFAVFSALKKSTFAFREGKII